MYSQCFCLEGSSVSIAKMDCGPFFCPNVEMVAVTVAEKNSSSTTNDSLDYCCYTIPEEGEVDISMPYCCNYEEYAENSYTMTGFGPVRYVIDEQK